MMPTRMSDKKKTSLQFPTDILGRVAAEAKSRGMKQSEWMVEALQEKFDRIDTGKDEAWGPLAQLSEADRGRVKKLIRCLLDAPRDRGFRRAVDANFAWLMETVPRQPRE